MLNEPSIRALLSRVAGSEQTIDEALASLRLLPFEDLGFAKIDHHRELRRGFPEAIYCAGKIPEQVAQISARVAENAPRLLGTRATREHFTAAKAAVPDLEYDELARIIWFDREPE